MIGVNGVDQQEWWVSDGYWYPPLASRCVELNPDILFSELGLIRVRKDRRRLSIWWDVDNVDQASLDCLLDYLAKLPGRGGPLDFGSAGPTEIRIHALKVGWIWESLATSSEAAARIRDLRALRGIGLLPQTYVSARVSADADFGASVIPLAFALFGRQGWYEKLRCSALADFGLFFSRDAPSDQLQFSQVGRLSDCTRTLGEAWRRQAIGTAADLAFADRQFDRRISRSYEEALTAGEPLFEHIVGFIDIGDRHIWLPYQRLLLPDRDRLACFTAITRNLSTFHPMMPASSSRVTRALSG